MDYPDVSLVFLVESASSCSREEEPVGMDDPHLETAVSSTASGAFAARGSRSSYLQC
jgi:hypothetical protein